MSGLQEQSGPLGLAEFLPDVRRAGRMPDHLRDKIAIFADGRCWIARGHTQDVDVLSAIALARRLGVPVQPPDLVDLGMLRGLYVDPLPRSTRRDDSVMRRELQELLRFAAEHRASDLHLIVDDDHAVLRARIDGELQPLPTGLHGQSELWRGDYGRQICLTAYAMAAEGGVADANYDPLAYQAARITRHLPVGVQAVRLQFNPMGYAGRHLAMRLLYAEPDTDDDFVALGFAPAQIALLEHLARQPVGLLLVAGPTGAGKSTTLDRLLRHIRRTDPGANVMSVEDPPEYRIPGVIQLPVANLRTDEDRDVAYADAIAAALRSDPDRMMIGEIRTRATARAAFEAAMTGHQVLSTVHAHDALSIVPRLRDLGVEPYKLRDASLVRGLIAQRLFRRLCPICRRSWRPTSTAHDWLIDRCGDAVLFQAGSGCSACRHGYQGRTVIAEIVETNAACLDALIDGNRTMAWQRCGHQGQYGRMVDHAIDKLIDGEIDVAQVVGKLGDVVPS